MADEKKRVPLWLVASAVLLVLLAAVIGFIETVRVAPRGMGTPNAPPKASTAANSGIGDAKRQLTLRSPHGVRFIAFRGDGKKLASGEFGGDVRLWDVTAPDGKEDVWNPPPGNECAGVAFVRTGLWVAWTRKASEPSSTGGAQLAFQQVDPRGILRPFRLVDGPIISVRFSPTGQIAASEGLDGSTALCNVQTTTKLQLPFRGRHTPVCGGFSSDGRLFATCIGPHTIALCDVNSGDTTTTLDWHTSRITSIAMSPDGRAVAAGDSQGNAMLWRLTSPTASRLLAADYGEVRSISFSPDSRRLATGGFELRLWDAVTGKALAEFKGHENVIFDVAFSPDGKTLASGSYDKSIMLWSVPGFAEPK